MDIVSNNKLRTADDFKRHTKLPVFENISYDYFFNNLLKLNKPHIFKNIAAKWKATELWIEDNKPCFNYLEKTYGEYNVTVYKCNEKYFNSQQTCNMKFKDYLKYWKEFGDGQEKSVYYLKDWHLKNEDETTNFYEVPLYFSSDWLNEYLTSSHKDDYRFVYMGPAGSWTPFHQDVFSSYSWSANICGKKRWIIFPPGEENKLLDHLGNLPYDIGKVPDDIEHYDIIQDSGDAIFVPSGWYHQVWNLENTISINHNWINGCNIKIMWHALENNLENVKREIADCEGMDNYYGQCQIILKATFGMDIQEFVNFISFIALKRLKAYDMVCPQETGRPTDKKYICLDLCALKDVLEILLNHSDIETYSELSELKSNTLELLNKIVEALN